MKYLCTEPRAAVWQGEGDEQQRITAKLEGILDARKDQYAQADIQIGLGAPDEALGASPAVVTQRCGLQHAGPWSVVHWKQ